MITIISLQVSNLLTLLLYYKISLMTVVEYFVIDYSPRRRSWLTGPTADASPLFLQQLAVALPPLLVDGVGVEYGQADDDEGDGGGRHQHLQGQVHLLRLGAASGDVAGEAVRGEAETERDRHEKTS